MRKAWKKGKYREHEKNFVKHCCTANLSSMREPPPTLHIIIIPIFHEIPIVLK